jgi:hypothetical protein
MKKYFNSLRPFEKRVVVGVGLALFAVLNLWIVFPHFSDMKVLRQRLDDARTKKTKYEMLINQVPIYNSRIRQLISAASADVPTAERATDLMLTVNSEAARNGVTLQTSGRLTTRTNNPYFVELSQPVSAHVSEKELVDFLYSLSSGQSLIRVQSMNMRPDPARFQLDTSITLVASYQKPAKPTKPATKTGPGR